MIEIIEEGRQCDRPTQTGQQIRSGFGFLFCYNNFARRIPKACLALNRLVAVCVSAVSVLIGTHPTTGTKTLWTEVGRHP